MKTTIIDQIEITSQGHVQVRMKKLFVDTDGSVTELGYHRTLVEVGGDCDKQIGVVNAHLAQMGFGPVSIKEIAALKAHAQLAATPERIAAYREILADQQKELSPQA
jgi:hypothetical protein